MNELIKITYNNDRPAVSARDLHDFLEVGARFNDWFPRMCEYGFIQDQLNILSSKCGFGETYYRFDGGSVATATQVISENSTMFRTIKKHEIILEDALVELCRILLRLGNTAMGAGLNEDVEISIDFDDSIIEDKQTDFSRDMQLLQAGIMNDWEFRMRWMNEDEATAKAALPKMQDMTKEPEEEIE